MSGAVKILDRHRQPRLGPDAELQPERGQRDEQRRRLLDDGRPAPVWNANGAMTNNGSPSWTTVSHSYYADNIINRHTGATVLRLPLVSQGATPIDLIRRPLVNSDEDTTNPLVFGQRYFGPMAGLRILLSDRAEDITNLPTVTADAPIWLDGDWNSGPRHPSGVRRVRGRCDPSADCAIDRPDQQHDGAAAAAPTRLPTAQIYVNGAIDRGIPGTGDHDRHVAPAGDVDHHGLHGSHDHDLHRLQRERHHPGRRGNDGTLTATLPSGLTVSTATNITAVQTAPARTTGRSRSTRPLGNPQPTARFVPGLMWVNGERR